MIEEGRQAGWLRLPASALQPWTRFHGATLNGVRFDAVAGKEDRGMAIVAEEKLTNAVPNDESDADDTSAILQIPQTLILSRQLVEEHALYDRHLRDVLDAVGSFAKVVVGIT